jgi:uncharacterized HhH-GPD family protein
MPDGAVALELLRFGRQLDAQAAAQTGGSFTTIPEADELLRRDPGAFVLGTLFTQGVPAERAWAGPYLLAQRLGHLDLTRLASEPEAVAAAVQQSPMLHRFKNTLPRWVSSAARRILEEYEGDAARIWESGSSVADVIARLSAFDGIGRKKAVMAAEILRRHLGVPLSGRERGQVAYDVHVRRVFLRSGLVERDSVSAIETAASEICPAAPAVLDLPAWLIGRDSCRPKDPRCGTCRLGSVCPRLTWIEVEGVGARRT